MPTGSFGGLPRQNRKIEEETGERERERERER
jgi:hypothetical protein